MSHRPCLQRAAVGARLLAAPLLLLAAMLASCGDGPRASLMLTYTKQNSSEQRMLKDREDLEHTDGVVKVIEEINSDNAITLQLYLDEDNSIRGRQRALDLGYQQVRN